MDKAKVRTDPRNTPTENVASVATTISSKVDPLPHYTIAGLCKNLVFFYKKIFFFFFPKNLFFSKYS
jgi:hypothetical protein